MKTTLLVALIVFFCPYLARADTPSVPDISSWVNISTLRIKFRISESAVIYLGLEASYYNPSNHREFVKVVSRHVPMVFVQPKIQNDRLFSEVSTSLYAGKEQKDRLEQLDKQTDPILYVQWRTANDSLDGRGVREGDVNIWFLRPDEPNGVLSFFQNEKVAFQFLTENVGDGVPRNVLAGRKYQVDSIYHILKAERRDLIRGMERGK
ncbi:MAG: hypothetical protein HY506_02325 [Candidatus Yanofskybacteria bacterium]|nr:hypothetical protein [Candidatus Yanofskybacteria bacterium]